MASAIHFRQRHRYSIASGMPLDVLKGVVRRYIASAMRGG